MANFKGTPGPWIAYSWAFDCYWGVQADRRKGSANVGRKIASIENQAGQDAGEEEEANARLIAAAPDMLAALERASHSLSRFAEDFPRTEDDLLSEIDRAIAKAKGETQ